MKEVLRNPKKKGLYVTLCLVLSDILILKVGLMKVSDKKRREGGCEIKEKEEKQSRKTATDDR